MNETCEQIYYIFSHSFDFFVSKERECADCNHHGEDTF